MSSNGILEFTIEHRTPTYTLDDLCEICQLTAERICELVDYGVINPSGASRTDWRFETRALIQTRRALRLQRDLEINLAGIALALELIDENEQLRRELESARAHVSRFNETS